MKLVPAPSALSRWLFWGLIGFMPLVLGGVHNWTITVMQMVVLTAVAFLLVDKARTWDWRWIPTPMDLPFLCLLLICLMSWWLSQHRATSTRAMLMLLTYLAAFYGVVHGTRTRRQWRHLIFLIVAVGVFLSLFGIIKMFGLNPFPWWEYPYLNYPPDFMAATYGNHNHLAGFLEMALPLALGMLLCGFFFWRRMVLVYLACLLLAGLILSLSRGGWIATVVGLSLMAVVLLASRYFARKRLIIALIVGTLALCTFIITSTPVVARLLTVYEQDENASFGSRVQAWKGIIDMIRQRPWQGSGPGTFALIFPRFQPPGLTARFTMAHNDYLQFIAEGGLVLIPVGLWMVMALFRHGFHKLGHSSRFVRGLTLGAMSGIVAILVHSIVDFNLHIPANALLFTVLAATVAAPLPQAPAR